VLTRKRKRGTEGRSSPKRPNYQDLQSLPPDSQEIATSNETRKVSHQKPKIGDDRLMNTEENNEEPSGTERERKQNFHGSDDWTEEQDVALRKAYFSARPSPHFWKRVSKLVIRVLMIFALVFSSFFHNCNSYPKNHYCISLSCLILS